LCVSEEKDTIYRRRRAAASPPSASSAAAPGDGMSWNPLMYPATPWPPWAIAMTVIVPSV